MSERAPVGRFAPSPTGPAHPGTLLSGLLAWLDARAHDARFVLRLEDIDPQRAKRSWGDAMLDDLAWFGLDWDEVVIQTHHTARHHEWLDRLADAGLLYGCTCTRAILKQTASIAADGSRRYPGTCRHRQLTAETWRDFAGSVRARVPEKTYEAQGLAGDRLVFEPATEMGDPIVRRKDGAVAYHLAVVADDHAAGVTRVVRGNDLHYATGVHLALYEALAAPAPAYYHHALLMEPRPARQGASQKLAKLHGSIGATELRRHMTPDALCGFLAACVGLVPAGRVTTPQALLADFRVTRLTPTNRTVTWTGQDLRLEPLS